MNIFDVIGPIMIGPSSSHTAGAVRLGKIARIILGDQVKSACLGLHGSFARTYRGHGTDLALIAGLMGWNTDDERIAQSFEYAQMAGLEYSFSVVDLGESMHPNSVKLWVTSYSGNKCEIIGSSIGGGRIVVREIDGFAFEFSGEFPALLTIHQDEPGVISQVTSILAKHEVNIAQMKVSRKKKGGLAAMVVETDQLIDELAWQAVDNIKSVTVVRRIQAM